MRLLASVKVSVCADSLSPSKTSNVIQTSIIFEGIMNFIPSPRKELGLSSISLDGNDIGEIKNLGLVYGRSFITTLTHTDLFSPHIL